VAKQQEDLGFEGTWAAQVFGPPFSPLAAAATSTERLLLGTGIAIAFTRSPCETVMAAIDLDSMSNGRTVLGSSVKSWTEGIFGMPYGKTVEHLRETTELLRLIIAKAHTGELDRLEGKYHLHDFSELQPPGPPLRTEIPICVSALRGAMLRLSAEIADGVIGHPIWSPHWETTTIPEQLKKASTAVAGTARMFRLTIGSGLPQILIPSSRLRMRGLALRFMVGSSNTKYISPLMVLGKNVSNSRRGQSAVTIAASPIWFRTRWRARL